MDVEVFEEELKDYRSWLRLVHCGQELLGGRNGPLVAVKARVADVGKHVTLAVPSENFGLGAVLCYQVFAAYSRGL